MFEDDLDFEGPSLKPKRHPECQRDEIFVGNENVWYDEETIPDERGGEMTRFIPRQTKKLEPNKGDRFGNLAYDEGGEPIVHKSVLPVFKKFK